MSQKVYMKSQLLNQANIYAGIQSLLPWFISHIHVKSLFKMFFWQNFFICYPI